MTFYFLLIIVRFSDFLDFKHKFNNRFSTKIPLLSDRSGTKALPTQDFSGPDDQTTQSN